MISRKTATAIGKGYEYWFMHYTEINTRTHEKDWRVRRDVFYDFLYENDYPAWICNQARNHSSMGSGRRAVRDWFMKLHTGESLYAATPDWSWEEREKLGQQYLRDSAQDILNSWPAYVNSLRNEALQRSAWELHSHLVRSLELDGYTYRDSRLLVPESDVLDVEEETGVLQSLYTQLSLPNKDGNFQFLKYSEEHYIAERWADSIANSRKFLEGTLREVAAVHSLRVKQNELPEGTYKRAVRVRDYLESEGLLDTKEKETVSSIYGLLSETGSHPNMAYNDQARLLRQTALTFSQFVMLRLQGSLSST